MKVLDYLLSMAARTTGVRVDEVTDISERQAFNGLAKLVRTGQVHKAVIAHRHVRYFKHIGMRDLFVEQVKRSQFEQTRKAHTVIGGSAPWGANTPAVRPEHVKVQVCPAYRPRFQEHTFGFVHGVA